jgi:hypothetical protein
LYRNNNQPHSSAVARALIAGDAITTMNLDSLFGTLLKRTELCRPPVLRLPTGKTRANRFAD